ncbi:MAG TPA: hypothetical protein VEQ41_09960 [Solirubrobacterales bacterium]|nr:hypothetical protein [Solirubrobacterales bacterium]
MSMKLKVLGLGILAVMATSAFTVMNASAQDQPNSHFTSEAEHVIIKGKDAFGSGHSLQFKGSGDPISCTDATYHGTIVESDKTTQAIQVRPHYTQCATTSGTWGSVTVHVPTGCGTNVYEFTSGNPGTIHVNCQITITHPNCTIRVPVQTRNGATYTQVTEQGKHAITLHVNAPEITTHYESGICVFLGTSHTSTMTGNATVWGENQAGGRVGITAT